MSNKISDDEFRAVCDESISMALACSKLGLHFNTFRRRALALGCYRTNQSGRGINKVSGTKIDLLEILRGNYPQYQTNKLKKRLILEGIKAHQCEMCGNKEWLNQKISLELHHKDGNRCNHKLDNLQLLCPNCHSYTDTYRGKNLSAFRET